jgi:hypothetical protein
MNKYINNDFDSYKTRTTNTLLWQGAISDGEFLKFSIDNNIKNKLKAISFKFHYSSTNDSSVAIVPIEFWTTTNMNIIFVIMGKAWYFNFIPTYVSGNGTTISIRHLEDNVTDSYIKLSDIYGILK